MVRRLVVAVALMFGVVAGSATTVAADPLVSFPTAQTLCISIPELNLHLCL